MLLLMNLRRETPQNNNNNNKKKILSMESGMNRKLEENSRMTGEITKVIRNKLGLKSL